MFNSLKIAIILVTARVNDLCRQQVKFRCDLTVGSSIDLPVMLSILKIVNNTKEWYESALASTGDKK